MRNLLIMLFFISLLGCENNTENNKTIEGISPIDNMISINHLNIDEDEYTVLKSGGVDNSMIFQIGIRDKTVEKIRYWIDYYSDGTYQETLMDMESNLNFNEKQENKLYFSTTSMQSQQEIWTLAFRQDKGVASGKHLHSVKDIDSTITHSINNIQIYKDDVANLGMLVRNKGRMGVSSSDDIEKTIKENQDVYVLKCKLF